MLYCINTQMAGNPKRKFAENEKMGWGTPLLFIDKNIRASHLATPLHYYLPKTNHTFIISSLTITSVSGPERRVMCVPDLETSILRTLSLWRIWNE